MTVTGGLGKSSIIPFGGFDGLGSPKVGARFPFDCSFQLVRLSLSFKPDPAFFVLR